MPRVQQQSQNEDILKLLVNLNESVKSLGSRFDVYQRTVDDRFVKLNAEIVLLKNKVDLVEANSKSQNLN